MIIRLFISIIFFLILGVVLLFNTEQLLNDLHHKNKNDSDSDIQSQINQVKISKFKPNSPKNFKQFDLQGESANVLTENITQINKVNLKIYQDSQYTNYWNILAQKGKWYQKERITELNDQVFVYYPLENISIKSNNLWLDENKNLIYTFNAIHFQMPNQQVLSEGIKINYEHKIIQFNSKVKSLIEFNN